MKTVSEARQVPSVRENLDAIRLATSAAASAEAAASPEDDAFHEEVRDLVHDDQREIDQAYRSLRALERELL